MSFLVYCSFYFRGPKLVHRSHLIDTQITVRVGGWVGTVTFFHSNTCNSIISLFICIVLVLFIGNICDAYERFKLVDGWLSGWTGGQCCTTTCSAKTLGKLVLNSFSFIFCFPELVRWLHPLQQFFLGNIGQMVCNESIPFLTSLRCHH